MDPFRALTLIQITLGNTTIQEDTLVWVLDQKHEPCYGLGENAFEIEKNERPYNPCK